MNHGNLNVILTSQQLAKLNTHKPFQLSHTQLNQGGTGTHQIQLSLNKKAYNKAMRQIRNGKGMRVNPMKDIEGDVVYGGKINWKKVGRVAKSIGKSVTPLLAPAIIAGTTYATGNPLAGVVVNEALQTGVRGAGFGSILKKGSKYVPKSVTNIAKRELVNQIQQRTGSNLAGELSNTLLTEGINQTYNGSGFSDYLKTGKKYIPKSVVNAGKKELVKQIQQRTGSNLAGELSNAVLTAGVNQTYGSGFSDYLKTGKKYIPKSVVNAGKKALINEIGKRNTLAADLASGVLTAGVNEVYGGSMMMRGGSLAPNGLPGSVNPISRGAIRIKGSESAMAHAAKMRAARGTKGKIIMGDRISGGSFR